MIYVIDGETGAGKTELMVSMLYKRWKAGETIAVNFPVFFSPDNERVIRWHQLDEVYTLHNITIGIDEGQKLFDAQKWQSLPSDFKVKIASNRHDHLDIITTTQDFTHIDLRVRSNAHFRYTVRMRLRFPWNERVHPIFQWNTIIEKRRHEDSITNRITWPAVYKRQRFISRYFTKKLYETFGDISLEKYLCKLTLKDHIWLLKIYSREMVESGRKRL